MDTTHNKPSDMNPTDLQARLARLEGFLRADPANSSLLQDAFETALRLQAWDRAHALVQHGLNHGGNPLLWQLRSAEILLAPGDRIILDDDSVTNLEARTNVLVPATLYSRLLASRPDAA